MTPFVLSVSVIKIRLKLEDSSVNLNDTAAKATLLKEASLHNTALKLHLITFAL